MLKNYIGCAKKIRNKLVTNERIRNILFYNTEDALSKESPSEKEILDGNYVLTKPMESLSQNNIENLQSTFISISVPVITFDETSSAGMIKISIACAKDVWDIKEGSRLLILAEEIINMINYQQFGFAGKMELEDINLIDYNANFTGYEIGFIIVDEQKSNVDF